MYYLHSANDRRGGIKIDSHWTNCFSVFVTTATIKKKNVTKLENNKYDWENFNEKPDKFTG